MGLVFKLFSAPHAKQPGAVNAPNPPFLLGEKDILLYILCFLFCLIFFAYAPSFCSPPGGGSVHLWGWDVALEKGEMGKGEGVASGSHRH